MGLCRDYIGIISRLYRGYTGIMENKTETKLQLRIWVQGLGLFRRATAIEHVLSFCSSRAPEGKFEFVLVSADNLQVVVYKTRRRSAIQLFQLYTNLEPLRTGISGPVP